jgi:ribonucleotide reductase class II
VVLTCRDFGYDVVPAQSCRDENGNLLDDINNPRVNKWLVEIPVEIPWVNKLTKELKENQINPTKFSTLAQFDSYIQVQKYYTAHNTSTITELGGREIEPLARVVYDTINN